jgi:hypothetical protein
MARSYLYPGLSMRSGVRCHKAPPRAQGGAERDVLPIVRRFHGLSLAPIPYSGGVAW